MSRKKWLQRAAGESSLTPETSRIDPRVAFRESLLFAFSQFNDSRSGFECTRVGNDILSRIFDVFKLFSQIDRNTVHTQYRHCHDIDDVIAKKHNLHDLIGKSPTGKIFQFGKRAHPERVIGYFEQKQPNVFQVCFFDLNHQIYPEH